MFTAKDNKVFWEKRAKVNPYSWRAGSNDGILLQLEIDTLTKRLKEHPQANVLDVGCGNGFTIKTLKEKGVPVIFSGMDISPTMVKYARKMTDDEYFVADVSDFSLEKTFEVAFSVRCLINLESIEKQINALSCISKHLVDGGLYYCLEPCRQGLININQVRKENGLEPIETPWHNNYVEESIFKLKDTGFDVIEEDNFASTYYLASRLFNALAVRQFGREADYNDPINLAASRLPAFGNYAPHKLVVLKKRPSYR